MASNTFGGNSSPMNHIAVILCHGSSHTVAGKVSFPSLTAGNNLLQCYETVTVGKKQMFSGSANQCSADITADPRGRMVPAVLAFKYQYRNMDIF